MIGDQGHVLVFNGEIYNFPELRRRARRTRGRGSTASCDSEVILKLYERHGEAVR